MTNSVWKASLLASVAVGAVALMLAPSTAEATCTVTPGATTTVDCTGTTNLPTPEAIVTPGNVAVTLGSDGNPATLTYTAGTPISVTLTGPSGTFGSLDTGNTGTPSAITGATDGFDVTSTNGANINIGQNSAGGNGLNANVTGQNGFGMNVNSTGTGSVSITTAPGTTVTGTNDQAIYVTVNNGNANLTLNGSAVVLPQFANAYSVQVYSTGTGNINIGGSGNFTSGVSAYATGTGSITIGGTASVNFEEQGTVTNGLLDAHITNAASSAPILITLGGSVNGTTNQNGILAINAGTGPISITGTGAVTAGTIGIQAIASGGDVTIAPASSVTAGGDAINASTTGSGNITITTAGAISSSGGYGIDIASAGTGTTTINIGSGSTISGASGAIYLGGTTSVINNAGTINGMIAGTSIDPLTINNAGAFNINSAGGTNVQSVNTFNGQGGTLGITVNPSAGTADLLKVTNLSGTTHINPTVIGPTQIISTPINVIEAANVAGGTTVTSNGSGLFTYGVKTIADPTVPGQTDYQLFSALNVPVAAAAPQTIDTVITALETGFFQNSSAFISEPANPKPNQVNGGPWVRFATGNDTTFGTASASINGGSVNSPEKISTNFSGFQTGVDLGVANVQNTGWNTHVGVTTGQVVLGVNDEVTTSISNQTKVTFVGIYGAITGHGFFADAQVRGDFYGMNLTNPGAGLAGAPLSGNAVAFNMSAGYHFNLPKNWFIEPSAAFLYDRLNVDSLSYGTLGTQSFNPFLSDIGRFGVRVGTTFIFDKAHVAVQPFVVGSIWHEFAGATTSTYIAPGGSSAVPLSVSRIGTFGQASAGVSAQILNTGFVGFARGDYRFGDYLQGYAAVVGLRYGF